MDDDFHLINIDRQQNPLGNREIKDIFILVGPMKIE